MRVDFTVNPSVFQDTGGNRGSRHFTGRFTVKSENRGVVCHSQRVLWGVVIEKIPHFLFLIPYAFPRGF